MYPVENRTCWNLWVDRIVQWSVVLIVPLRFTNGEQNLVPFTRERQERSAASEVSSPESTIMRILILNLLLIYLCFLHHLHVHHPTQCFFIIHILAATAQTATKCGKCVDKSTLINSLVNKLSFQVKLMSKILGDSLVVGNRSEITYQRFSSKLDIASVVSL